MLIVSFLNDCNEIVTLSGPSVTELNQKVLKWCQHNEVNDCMDISMQIHEIVDGELVQVDLNVEMIPIIMEN